MLPGKQTRVREKIPLNLRKRVPVACAKCRRMKTKCSGGFPCDLCKSNGQECKIEPIERRSKKPEIDLQATLDYICKLERIVKFMHPETQLDYIRNNIDAFERSVYSKGSRLVTLGAPKLFNPTKAYYQSTTEHSFVQFFEKSGNKITDSGNLYHVDHNNQYRTSFTDETLQKALDILPTDEEIFKILETFFLICSTNYFYLHPREYFKDVKYYLEMKSQNRMDFLRQNWIVLVILLAIISITAGYEFMTDDPVIDISDPTIDLDAMRTQYYEACLGFVGDLIACNTRGSSKALLLIGLFLTTNESEKLFSTTHNGYLYIYLATEVAIINGLHLKKNGPHTPEDESDARFWWTCYCVERRYGLNLAKAELIKSEEITVGLPQYCEELCYFDGSTNFSLQSSIVQLTFIISRISSLMSTVQSEDYIRLDSKIIKSILVDLEDWKANSPAKEPSSSLDPENGLFRAHMHIRLNYLFSKLYISKPFLLYKVENYSIMRRKNFSEAAYIDHMTSICMDAAFGMIQLLSTLEETNKLGLYSSTDLSFCNLSLFVIVVFLKIDKSEGTIFFLKRGLDILRKLSTGCSSAKSALNRLSNIEKRFPEFFSNIQVDEYKGSEMLLGQETGLNNFPEDDNLELNLKFHKDGDIKPFTVNEAATKQENKQNDEKEAGPYNNEWDDFDRLKRAFVAPYQDIENFVDWTKDINILNFELSEV